MMFANDSTLRGIVLRRNAIVIPSNLREFVLRHGWNTTAYQILNPGQLIAP
jgi:hypothetical protein